jgi:hypothetical protein
MRNEVVNAQPAATSVVPATATIKFRSLLFPFPFTALRGFQLRFGFRDLFRSLRLYEPEKEIETLRRRITDRAYRRGAESGILDLPLESESAKEADDASRQDAANDESRRDIIASDKDSSGHRGSGESRRDQAVLRERRHLSGKFRIDRSGGRRTHFFRLFFRR